GVCVLLGISWNRLTSSTTGRITRVLLIVGYVVFLVRDVYSNRLYIMSIEPGAYQRVLSLQPAVLLNYRTLHIRLSRSGDWGTRLRVQLTDGDSTDLRQLSPSNLRISRAGHLEIVADVFVHSIDVVDGPVTLVTEGFDDFRRPAGLILTNDQTGSFHLPAK